jgi:hypothetical protein
VKVAATPSDPARDKELVDALSLAITYKDDQSAWSMVLDRFDALLGLAKSSQILDLARQGREDFVAHIRRRADAELVRVRRDDADPLVQLRNIDGFPKPLLALDILRDLRQTLREDRERLLERLDVRFLEDEAALDRCLAADDFAGAGQLVKRMLQIVEVLPYARERRLPRIQKVRDAEIPRRERDAADRLVQAWEPVHAALERELMLRKTDVAWAHAVKFLKDHKEPELRASNVNYDLLLGLVPDPQLPESRLTNALLMLGATWTDAADELCYRILADFQDILDIQSLSRQVYAGLRRLSAGGPEVKLETLKGSGRISLGPRGYEFVSKSGPSRPFNPFDLRPPDQVLLAAAADNATPEKAMEANASLVRAAGVAWLYSSTTEKWARAETLLTQAQDKRAPVPAFRRERLRNLGRAQAREALGSALKLSAAKKFDEAQRMLLELAAAWTHDLDMRVEIGRALAVVSGAEMRRAGETRDYLRVKALARQIFELDAEQYNQAGFVQVFGHAVRNTLDWGTLRPDPQDAAWSWEGREQKTPPPATDRTAAGEGLLLQADRPLWVSKKRSQGASGFNAQLRVQDKSKPVEVSLLFDGAPDGRRQRVVFREPDEILLFEGAANRETLVRQVKLEARITPGRWFDLGWAVDSGSLVVYVDQRALFAMRGSVRPDGAIGLVSSLPMNIRTPQVRR